MNRTANPHIDQPVMRMGASLDEAKGAMLLLHGRGASAADILSLAMELDIPEFMFLAPQAAEYSWYPRRFLDPIQSNEPWLSSALQVIERTLDHLINSGIPPQYIILLGFSQGACLALEFASRNPKRYGGLVGLSGGLIGAEGELLERDGSLEGTPVFLGCSPNDPHIPRERFEETARKLDTMGGDVIARLYPDLGHGVNEDELEFVRGMMEAILRDLHAKSVDGD